MRQRKGPPLLRDGAPVCAISKESTTARYVYVDGGITSLPRIAEASSQKARSPPLALTRSVSSSTLRDAAAVPHVDVPTQSKASVCPGQGQACWLAAGGSDRSPRVRGFAATRESQWLPLLLPIRISATELHCFRSVLLLGISPWQNRWNEYV